MKRLVQLRGGPAGEMFVEVDERAHSVVIPVAVNPEPVLGIAPPVLYVGMRYDIDWGEQVGTFQGEQQW